MRIGVNKVISFTVNGQTLKRTDNRTVVNKAHNIVICRFTFQQKSWNDVSRFVLFTDGEDTYNVPLLDNESIVECTVPYEVLMGEWFKLTLYGGDLITTNQITVNLVESGYTTDVSSTSEPSRDVFIDMYERLDGKADRVHTHDVGDIQNLESILDDVPSREELESDLDLKSDVGHTHTSSDVVDFGQTLEDEIDEDLDLLLLNLSEKINEI